MHTTLGVFQTLATLTINFRRDWHFIARKNLGQKYVQGFASFRRISTFNRIDYSTKKLNFESTSFHFQNFILLAIFLFTLP